MANKTYRFDIWSNTLYCTYKKNHMFSIIPEVQTNLKLYTYTKITKLGTVYIKFYKYMSVSNYVLNSYDLNNIYNKRHNRLQSCLWWILFDDVIRYV